MRRTVKLRRAVGHHYFVPSVVMEELLWDWMQGAEHVL